jgi:hypothetical protein
MPRRFFRENVLSAKRVLRRNLRERALRGNVSVADMFFGIVLTCPEGVP